MLERLIQTGRDEAMCQAPNPKEVTTNGFRMVVMRIGMAVRGLIAMVLQKVRIPLGISNE